MPKRLPIQVLLVLSIAWGAISVSKADKAAKGSAKKGKALFHKLSCQTCHSVDGKKKIGPTMKGIYGQKVKLKGGQVRVRDAAYFRTQLLDPKSVVVDGYMPMMPSYKGQVNEAQIKDITAYIASLKAPKTGKVGKASGKAKAVKKSRRRAEVRRSQKLAALQRSKSLKSPYPNTPKLRALGKHYYQLNCAFCHGAQGKGDGPGGRALPVTLQDFSKGKFLYGDAPGTVFHVISHGSPGSPLMPSWSSFPKKLRWAMTLYVLSLKK